MAWLLAVYLEQVEDISSIQAVVTKPVQQLHLSARRQLLKGALAQWVGLPLLQLPAVVDDVVQVTAECLGTGGEGWGGGGGEWEKERERCISSICRSTPCKAPSLNCQR